MIREAHAADEKFQKAMLDAAKLADELRGEQETCLYSLKDCKLRECQLKDMHTRLDETEVNAMKGGKKAMNKMDSRIRELESEIDAETRRYADAQKNLRKSERRLREITYVQDEDRKNQERMTKMIESLENKVKSYKKQIEEAEEIAALNLSKFRQAQDLLQQTEQRADLNEKALSKAVYRERSAERL